MMINSVWNLDVDGAAHAFSQTGAAGLPESLQEYLMQHLVKPILQGETVLVGDLDLAAFDEGDLSQAACWCEKMERLFTAAGHLQAALRKLPSVPRNTPFF